MATRKTTRKRGKRVTSAIDDNGVKEFRNKKGELHNDNGPAVIDPNGDTEWRINGELHNENGPAVITINGDQHWYLNGKRHRIGGPAIILINGNKWWYKEGKIHRDDGPAMVMMNGKTEWWKEGKRFNDNKVEEQLKRVANKKAVKGSRSIVNLDD